MCFFYDFLGDITYRRKSSGGGALRAISCLAAPLLQSCTEVHSFSYSPQNTTLPRTASTDGNGRGVCGDTASTAGNGRGVCGETSVGYVAILHPPMETGVGYVAILHPPMETGVGYVAILHPPLETGVFLSAVNNRLVTSSVVRPSSLHYAATSQACSVPA